MFINIESVSGLWLKLLHKTGCSDQSNIAICLHGESKKNKKAKLCGITPFQRPAKTDKITEIRLKFYYVTSFVALHMFVRFHCFRSIRFRVAAKLWNSRRLTLKNEGRGNSNLAAVWPDNVLVYLQTLVKYGFSIWLVILKIKKKNVDHLAVVQPPHVTCQYEIIFAKVTLLSSTVVE